MTSKAAADELSKEDAKYLTLINKHLAEIQVIQQDMARRRAEGRKVKARIDRNLKQIQATIDRVEATL